MSDRITIMFTFGKELHTYYASGRKVIRYCASEDKAKDKLASMLLAATL